jgi:hypothetical protein
MSKDLVLIRRLSTPAQSVGAGQGRLIAGSGTFERNAESGAADIDPKSESARLLVHVYNTSSAGSGFWV